jgi:hypothetical protein
MRIFLHMILVMFTILSVVTFFIVGPKLESVLNPVVSDFKIIDIDASPERTIVQGVLTKNRGECVIESLNVAISADPNDPNAKMASVNFSTDNVVHDRPAGSQYWGPWELKAPSQPLGPVVTITSRHRCHVLWEVETLLWSGLTSQLFPYDYKEISQ